ncbi:LamG domain-containing protein [Actinoplanes sp. TBRC 11911]|uniref:LamG domain-containing protein n=1 Tax=Actinoplanes sp. TBRC 11911 TaxID=2729386 RepID=UPI00145D5DEE|nr:LamG domain-containing protein [Actinoplanes sp. TBRC 11911]NMO50682.1 LamG domain-containing protein [Actinoplanes sp. TBRC 11911]
MASPTAVVLSGGGSGPLARTASQGQELVWTWTGVALPKPTLSGAVATYASVLPDVDLKVRVDEWGFSETLVVKTADAAANPALSALRFALSGSGLSAVGAAGQATSPDDAVTDVFHIGAAAMWDSTGPASPPSASMPAEDVQSELVSTSDGPGSGAKVVEAPTTMDGTTLVVTPSRSLLSDPASTFPIFIDPTSSAPLRTYWAMINKGVPAQEYWDFDRADHAKVGNAGTGVDMYRSLFQFSTSAWKGKHVTSATFSDDLVHSWSCSNTQTELHHVTQALGKNTTWNLNAPAWGGSSLVNVSNQNCHDAAGVHSEWSSTALASEVNSATGNATITFGLRAASEAVSFDGSNGWKKFDETGGAGGAKLSVTYNTAPAISNLHTDAAACASSAAAAPPLSTVGSPAHSPVPQVTVKDAEADKSTVSFTYPKPGGGTLTTSYANVASGASQKLVTGIPAAAILSGGTYTWSVSVSDGTDSSTATCYFKIDNTVPQPPTIVSADGAYPDDDSLHGGVGKPGSFTIRAAGDAATVAAVVKYAWGPSAGGPLQTVTTSAGAPVTVSYTPPVEGDNTLQAYAYTATGVVSAMGSADFLVDNADQPVGLWALDGDGTDTGTGDHAATAANVTWTGNGRQIGHSVAHFNGTSAALTATPPIHTNTSFAVAAWVRPTGTSCTGNAVSQDGVHTSGFYLGCFQGKFDFDMIASDSSSVASTRLLSTATANTGVWTSIAGVYDRSAGKISLYVNGVLQSSATLSGQQWDAAGPFAIGRDRYTDISGDWWAGDISDVRVWDRVGYASDIAGLSASSWADQYPLGFDPTQNKMDPIANPLTWTGGPQPGFDDMNPPDSGGTPATVLNSADPDYGLSARPAVRTDGSFSVSAWVNPATLTGAFASAVSQNGTVTSNFGLGVSAANHYTFWIHNTDTTSTPAAIVQSTALAVAGQWVNLIGTFDATTKQITLYVNGVSQGATALPVTPWHATGPVAVGSGLWQAQLGYVWNGGIDNAGLFNGVLNATEISNLYTFNDPYYVSADAQ